MPALQTEHHPPAASLRGVLTIIIQILLAGLNGCVSIPKDLESNLSWKGAHYTRIVQAGPILYTSNASLIPGRVPARKAPSRLVTCTHSSISIIVRSHYPRNLVHEFCTSLLRAVNYVTSGSPTFKSRISYEINLIPEGERISETYSRIQLKTKLHLRYSIPFNLRSLEISTENGLTTISHETFHVVSLIGRFQRLAGDEERYAYIMGACAQYSTTGSLDIRNIRRPSLEKLPKSSSAYQSASAGANAAHYFEKFFHKENTLLMESDSGRDLSLACSEFKSLAFSK